MAATAGSSAVIGRDVLYRFRFEVDGSARQAAEQTAKLAEDAFGRAEKAKKKEAAEHKKSLDDQIKQVEAHIKKIDEVTKLYENATAKRRASDMQLVASGKQALEGVTQLSRAIVLLGVSSEKDLQKAVQALAGFEAGAAAIKGTINILEAATKAWGAYRAAVLAAGVAQAGYAALGGAAAAGGRAAAGGVAGDVAVGAAGDILGGAALGGSGAVLAGKSATLSGAAGTVGSSIGGVIAAIVTSPAFIAAGIGLGIKAIQEAITNRPGEGMVSGAVMSIPGYRALAESLGPAFIDTGSGVTEGRRAEFIQRRQFEQAQAAREATRSALTSQLTSRLFENRVAGAGFDAFNAAGGGTAGSLASTRAQIGVVAGGGSSVALIERQVSLRERELDLVRQLASEQKQAATERIRGLENEFQAQQRIADSMRAQLSGAAERFGQLAPQEQQRTIDANRRLRAGQNLSPEDRRRLRGLGLDSTTAGVRAQDIADAERAGFSREFGGAERARLGAAQREQTRLSIAIQRQRDFIVRVESDTKQEAELLAREVARLMVERDEQLKREFNAELKRQLDQQSETRARDAQTAAALSGA